MNLPIVKDFFSNKVTIQLKNGHKFEGLLSSINYKDQTVILEDVTDLGNLTDKNFIPHDKKIVEKVFQSDNIQEILFKQKHFCQPKKYKKDDFWDATSEPVTQVQKKPYNNNGGYHQKRNYDNRDNNRDNRGGRRQNYNNNNYNNNRNYNNRDKEYKNYQQKGQYKKRDEKPQNRQTGGNDRDYR